MKAKDFLNKKATPADVKFAEKYIEPNFAKYVNPFTGTMRAENPFTGWSKETNVLVGTLVKFTQELIYHDFRKEWLDKWGVPEGQKIQLFDRARMLILKLDADIYMNVID